MRFSQRLRKAPVQYRPLSRIAAGGMAEVWRAHAEFEDGFRHEVAIKRVLPNMQAQLFRSMFEDEARLGMMLRHPNIVRVYDARDIQGTYIMVMELVDGAALKTIQDLHFEQSVVMPIPAGMYIIRELAKGLHYAHTETDRKKRPLGIVHRDVSPHNALLGYQGAVKLVDFGLADASVHETVRGQDMVGGKFGYLAPEVIRRDPVDHRIDIFALGIVLWEMLAGRRLFHGASDRETVQLVARCEVPPLNQVNMNVPEEIAQFANSLLRSDPDQRPHSAQSVAVEVNRIMNGFGHPVGPKDVAQLIAFHRDSLKALSESDGAGNIVAQLVADELSKFVAQGADTAWDAGMQPLDPDAFGG